MHFTMCFNEPLCELRANILLDHKKKCLNGFTHLYWFVPCAAGVGVVGEKENRARTLDIGFENVYSAVAYLIAMCVCVCRICDCILSHKVNLLCARVGTRGFTVYMVCCFNKLEFTLRHIYLQF